MAQKFSWVKDGQAIASSGLEHQLIALTQQLSNLNPQPVKYEFTGLSELAQSLSQHQSQSDAVENLAQVQPVLSKLTGQLVEIAKLPQKQVVDLEIDQVRSSASALIRQLQPGIEKLAGAINQRQRKAEVTQAIAQIGMALR